MDSRSYLQQHARKLDLYLYEYLFGGASPQPIFSELATYQNADGGFGKALEPDMRLPDSSALATVVAFQYLSHLPVSPEDGMVSQAIRYLMDSYDDATTGWTNIPPAADQFPRAPWWNYDSAQTWAEWGNPSAEILGYLLQYADLVHDDGFLQRLTEQAVRRLHEMDEPEPHEVKCYIRLHGLAHAELQRQLHGPLAQHIKRAAITNPNEWQGYVATPLTFIWSLDSPFAGVFDEQLLLEDAARLRRQCIDNTHWEPTWEWGQCDEDWATARLEWSGKLTVENLRLLSAFGLAIP
jgi:hypothetical protein